MMDMHNPNLEAQMFYTYSNNVVSQSGYPMLEAECSNKTMFTSMNKESKTCRTIFNLVGIPQLGGTISYKFKRNYTRF